MSKVSIEDKPEFIGQIIDLFEDFLDEKGVIINNPERDDEEDAEMAANIYGSDYGILSDGIEEILQRWELVEEE